MLYFIDSDAAVQQLHILPLHDLHLIIWMSGLSAAAAVALVLLAVPAHLRFQLSVHTPIALHSCIQTVIQPKSTCISSEASSSVFIALHSRAGKYCTSAAAFVQALAAHSQCGY